MNAALRRTKSIFKCVRREAETAEETREGNSGNIAKSGAAAAPSTKRFRTHNSDGANVSGASPRDNPLANAADKSLTEYIKCLLEAGANPNVPDTGGASPRDNPFANAAEKSLTEAIKCLSEAGANPNVLETGGANVSGASPRDNPLASAAEKGLTEDIKCLLEAGANPNVPDTIKDITKGRGNAGDDDPDKIDNLPEAVDS